MEINVGQQGLKEKLSELPGFRFHPTEQELVGFYLKRMVQGKLHNVNFIPVLDLYRYDPSDLPRFVSLGERELFFFVPREERCQNNRGRPNRMTASGYWKATGCERSVHNDKAKCIGLKKTLVFYRGRAPKGQKTDWIMNEYRLPDYFDKPKKEVVLCRIYRKATPQKWLEQRAMSQAEVTSTCEDLDCISQDSKISHAKIDENKRVHEAKSICVRHCDSVACHEITTEPSSSLSDKVTKTDIISFLGSPLRTGPVESTAYGNFVDPDFQGFADDDKGVKEFSSIIALLNSSPSPSSSVECCWEPPFIPAMVEGLISVKIPKRSIDFRNEEVASDRKWNTWTDLWSLPSI